MSTVIYKGLWSIYSHANKTMSAAELKEIGNSFQETASMISRDMSCVLEGIACQVSSEEMARTENGALCSGSFTNPGGVFALLCMAGRQFEIVASLLEIGGEAEFHAAEKSGAALASSGKVCYD